LRREKTRAECIHLLTINSIGVTDLSEISAPQDTHTAHFLRNKWRIHQAVGQLGG
jgi:hypothetical protein